MTDDAPALPDVRRRDGGRAGWALVLLTWAGLVALWGAAFAAAAGASLPWPAWVVLAVLPAVALVAFIGTLLVWTIVPDRPAAAGAMAAAGLAPLAWWGPTWPARPEAAVGPTLTVVTWNVARLTPSPAVPEPAACVARALIDARPGIAALQEVTAAGARDIGDAAGLDCIHAPYRPDAGDTLGEALCAPRDGPWTLGPPQTVMFSGTPHWAHLAANARHDAAAVAVRNVHLEPHRMLVDPWRRLPQALARFGERTERQASQGRDLVDGLPASAPAIVVGDLNATPGLPVHRVLASRLRDTWAVGASGLAGTVTAFGLPLHVDHVYATPDIAVLDAVVLDTVCSDHRALRVTLSVPSP